MGSRLTMVFTVINIKKQKEDSNQKAIEEILQLLKYLHSDENIRKIISPFKPLSKSKKISMV